MAISTEWLIEINGQLVRCSVIADNPVLAEETGRSCSEIRLENGDEISCFTDALRKAGAR